MIVALWAPECLKAIDRDSTTSIIMSTQTHQSSNDHWP